MTKPQMLAHTPRKRFGQNFLTDRGVVDAIISAINPQPTDNLVEIGPGLGALTRPLLHTLNHLHVVEIDRDIIARLQREYARDELTIHGIDVLEFDFAQLGSNIRVVGNLPYNISTPLLFHLNTYIEHIQDAHFMLQKEVVERMVAEPSSKEYGRLSVMLQYRLDMQNLFTVGSASFHPAPKVESAIVRLQPLNPLPHPAQDENLFAKIVNAAFMQRRKTLRNALSKYLTDEDFNKSQIDPMLRAENLSVADFVRLSNFISERQQAA